MFLHLVISSVLIANAMADVTCPAEWTLYRDELTCLKLLANDVVFSTAKESCSNELVGAKLVEVRDEAKKTQVSNVNDGNTVWLGMVDSNTDKTFRYSNGDALTYDAFGSVRPDDGMGCIIQLSGEWDAVSCDTTDVYRPLCEVPAEVTCDEQWFLLPGTDKCVRMFRGNRIRKEYDDAQADCVSKNGNLAMHVQKRSHIRTVMRTVSYKSHMWIGVDRLNAEQETKFVDGTEITGYMPFKKNRGLREKHQCAALKRGRWFGKRCSRKHAYLCEKDA